MGHPFISNYPSSIGNSIGLASLVAGETTAKMKLKQLFKSKSGVFDQLSDLGIGIASLAITLVVVFLILSQTGANSIVAADGNATAAVATLTDAASTIPGFVPLVVIAVIGAILLGLVAIFRRR